jgi:hypothetical protein
VPVFHVTSPDGKVIEVTAPEGATEEQAIAYAQQHMQPQTPPPAAPAEKPLGDRLLDLYKNATAAPLETAAQLVSGTLAAPMAAGAKLRTAITNAVGLTHSAPADIADSVQNALTYSPRTQGGQAAAKILAVPGHAIQSAGQEAGQAVANKTGSQALGDLTNGGIQATGNILLGEVPGMMGAAGSGLMRIPGIRPAVNMVQDIATQGTSAARRTMQSAAGSPGASQAAADAIATYQKAKAALDPNGLPAQFQPTTAQVAGNAGLAGLDRTLRNQPDLTTAFSERDAFNQDNINNILEGISGTADQRLRAQTARDLKARELYDRAINNPVTQHPLPTGEGIPPTGSTMPVPDGTDLGLNQYGTKLNELMKRPAMQQALAKARELAANDGVNLSDQNAIQTLHYMKQVLDDKIAAAGARDTSIGPAEQRVLLGAKNELLGVMDGISPEYQMARSTYQAMSDPLNRMDLGEYLRQKYMSALADAGGTGTRPSMFADALRNENTPRLATGFGGATWDNTLAPTDLENLNAAADQLGRQNFAQTAGRGVGSNTAQNLGGNSSLRNIASPNSISEDMGHPGMVALTLSHPAAALPLAVLGAGARRAAITKLGQAMLDHDLARKYLMPQPSAAPAFNSLALPAALGATASDDNHMADGGQPQYQKSSFWDLLKEGWRQITDPDDAPQPQQQQPPGNTASGPVGKDFDSYVNRNVDSMSR